MLPVQFWVWLSSWAPHVLTTAALPLGIAAIGAATSITIAVSGNASRRRERLQDIQERRLERTEQAEKELFLRRAEALEGFFAAIHKFAAEVDRQRAFTKGFTPEELKEVARPNDFALNQAISRLATRAREREMRDAVWRVVNAARYLPVLDAPTVLGPIQTILEKWHVGDLSNEAAITELDELTHHTHKRAENKDTD